jgi:phage baseplate assembly protein W
MSSQEKNIYKQVNIPSNKKPQAPVESRAYRGISTVDPDANNWVLYDIALIKQDLLNHFNIQKGEKLSDPTFGTIIWSAIYEPLTELVKQAIVDDVTEIVNYDPRVNAESIVVDEYDNGIQVECTLRYLQYNISESLRISFDENAGIL